jgi:hypothetical protein
LDTSLFHRFAPVVRALSPDELAGAPGVFDKLRIASEGPVTTCYAPFEYRNAAARVVIVGITPGRTQMLNALRECRRQLDRGADEITTLREAKLTGAFSGAMRPNLVALLDAIGIARWLSLDSCDALFDGRSPLAQTASALRNPVFVDGQNYNGTPPMTRHPMLRRQLVEWFGRDAASFPSAVFVPLGDKVADALDYLAAEGCITRDRILDGLPHPSGANAERIAYFLGRKSRASLSARTDPRKLDGARDALVARVSKLGCR